MPLDYDKLINHRIPDVEQTWTARDTMLYALGIGFGADPTDLDQLKFVYEQSLVVVPSMAVVLCTPHGWLQRSNAGMSGRNVAAAHGFVIHRQLPPEGAFVGKTRVTGIIDKGPGRGALVMSERKVHDRASGELWCTHYAMSYCKGDGGFNGPSGPVPVPHVIPERAPDSVCDFGTVPQAALLYRLSGDVNPLHVNPKVARKNGYPRPILHGLCSMGVAAHAILKTFCRYDASRLTSMETRFSAPVYPGESLRIEMWRDGGVVAFRGKVAARGQVVLDHGHAEIAV